jgi:TPP-dependent pyruvate/acetoin dehydrogenase alpha subunit
MSPSFDPVAAYRRIYLIRRVEEEIVKRYYPDPANRRESPMRCPVHLSIGQEGIAVGVAMAVPKGSHAYSTHRCHAHYLAWGGDLDRMVAELYGKATGCSGGRAGSMHLHDESVGFMGTSAIVGSSVSLAVGDAFSARLRGDDSRVTVAFGGDAILETGQFWESLNFAGLHKLKILFVIEQNGVATATPNKQRQWHMEFPTATWRANTDGAKDVWLEASTALNAGRPAILFVRTRRFHEHVGIGRMLEYAEYPDDDPVKQAFQDAADYLGEQRDEVLGDIEREADWRIQKAFSKAEAAPWPEASLPNRTDRG